MRIKPGDGVFYMDFQIEGSDLLRFDVVELIEGGILKLKHRWIAPEAIVMIVRKRAFEEGLVELP